MTNATAYTLSGRALIAQFGEQAELRDLAKRHGVALSYHQIRKWADRDTISSDGLAMLVMLADATGKKLDLIDAVRPVGAAQW